MPPSASETQGGKVVLPTVNFRDFVYGPDWLRNEAAKTITDSFIKHGFCKFINHGIPDDIVQGIFAWSHKFFHMMPEQKGKLVHIPSADPQRGWSHLGAETTAKLRQSNIDNAPKGHLTDEKASRTPPSSPIATKEHFDCGPRTDTQFPNLWPDPADLPGFREFMEAYFEEGQRISLQIMEACEVGLRQHGYDLPEGTLTGRCTPAASELRLNHYPPITIEKLKQGLTKRTWPHSDFGIITLLFQDAVGGLELEDRSNGSFVPVIREDPNEMVVNVSDTFARLTNNVISPGLHQVTNPVHLKGMQEGALPERYSSVFFFKAHRETSVGPLPAFVGPQRPALYPEMNALEFHQLSTKVLY